MMKVALQAPRADKPYTWRNPHSKKLAVTRALPFFRAYPGCKVHRVRSGQIYLWDGRYSHTVLTFWCGNFGHDRPRAEMFASVPAGADVCALCESRRVEQKKPTS